ncbi:MAG: FtsH protease activity modulator HflK [Caldilineaceae bacterium]|nr:FtsH protease activity modulator HflK [Caldilineaceae bacterium]MBP8109428.1 FtsH protease activity modulator HflK [Caldilineaceae bacterium]MBP8121880.1 FtsH protease activity modulator HflK [Caldilineaceae bacterium]MBP9073155.1 FtsH protease activity modulator HflK [Caldilineaceae bacterium]
MLNKPGSRNGDDLPPLSEYVDALSGWAAKLRGGSLLFILLALLLLWLATGIYSVQPGEEGVVQTFGRFTSVSTSGLNYHLPAPIQQVTIVNVSSIRRAEIGFRSTAAQRQDVLSEALMLTADENIVKVELLVQYRIADSRAFVFNVQDPEDVLLTSAEVALRDTVGKMTIDAVITEERARVQDQTRVILSQLMEYYKTGIQITDVRLQGADPPEEVRDAFQEVVRALADKERLINESQAYQNDIVPRARGNKQKLIQEADAFKQQRVLQATGDAERFLSILQAYRLAPDVTRERMHIESLEGVLQQVELTLLDPDAIGGQVLPFLPLKGLDSPDLSSPSLETAPAEGN